MHAHYWHDQMGRKLAAALLLCCMVGNASATGLRIVTVSVPPLGITGTDGKGSGNVFEIGNLIAEESGLSHENQIVPYLRAMEMLKAGLADMFIGFPNEALRVHANQVAPISHVEVIAIGRAGTRFGTLEDLHGKTVAIVRTAEYDERLSADTKVNKYFVNNYAQGLNMLLRYRLDAVVGMKEGLWFVARQNGIAPSALGTPLALSKRTAWLYLSRKCCDEGTAKVLADTVQRLQQNGAIRRIDEKYFETN